MWVFEDQIAKTVPQSLLCLSEIEVAGLDADGAVAMTGGHVFSGGPGIYF